MFSASLVERGTENIKEESLIKALTIKHLNIFQNLWSNIFDVIFLFIAAL